MPYIFGYGSLIEQASRQRSTPSAMYVLPARARGFVRGWWARTGSIGYTTTFAGAIPEKSSSINGVIYAVNQEELDETDKRESGYTRENIASHIEILSGGIVPKGEIYIYLNKFKEGEREKSVPSRDFPIVQSYVDICLNGCLQIEKGFRTPGTSPVSSSHPRSNGRNIGRTTACTRAALPSPSLPRRGSITYSRSICPSCSPRFNSRPDAGS